MASFEFKLQFIILIVLQYQTTETLSEKTYIDHRPSINVLNQSFALEDFLNQRNNSDSALEDVFLNLMTSLLPSAFEVTASVNISSKCSTALTEYMRGLSEMKLWAVKMLDGTGKLPNRILGGSPSEMGDFDTCLQLEHPSSQFKGQYCIIDIGPPKRKHNESSPDVQKLIVPDFSEEKGKKAISYAIRSRSSICLPSSCSKKEVQMIVAEAFKLDETGVKLEVSHCEVNGPVSFTSGEITIIIFLSVLLFAVIMGTVIDASFRKKAEEDLKVAELGTGLQCLLAFSLYTNLRNLLKDDTNPSSITVFHGIKTISMIWIVLDHSYEFPGYEIFSFRLPDSDNKKSFIFQIIANAHFSVDTFFFISSALVVYISMKKKDDIHILKSLWRRYWRMTPALMLVVALHCISNHFGSGPFWKEFVDNGFARKCKDKGWWDLLYLQNWIPSNTCFGYTWYVAADMQLYIIALFVIFILKRSTTKGFIMIAFIIISCILLSAFTHIYLNLPPTSLVSWQNKPVFIDFHEKGFYYTFYHAPASCVGLVVGYMLATKEIHINKTINFIGWVISLVVALFLIFIPYVWQSGFTPGVLESTLYHSTSKFIWTLCIGFFTVSCTVGQGGLITTILSWREFVLLGRLTYAVYLIHPLIFNLYMASSRSLIPYNHTTLVYLVSGVVVLSFLTAFIINLACESPLSSVGNILLTKMSSIFSKLSYQCCRAEMRSSKKSFELQT